MPVAAPQAVLRGQTLESKHGPPADTGCEQTRVVDPGADAEQTRPSAHSMSVQGPPSATWATQVPQTTPPVVNAQRPLAHCQESPQAPPLAMVPPRNRQAGSLDPARYWSQVMAATASPHCWSIAGVAPVCGASTEASQASCKAETHLARPPGYSYCTSPGSHLCAAVQDLLA